MPPSRPPSPGSRPQVPPHVGALHPQDPPLPQPLPRVQEDVVQLLQAQDGAVEKERAEMEPNRRQEGRRNFLNR